MSRILIIDDDAIVLSTLSVTLERQGFRVIKAKSLTEGLRAYQENPDFFAILFDGWLGGNTDSCDLIRTIKESYGGHMIAMSSDDDTRIRQMEAGCTHDAWLKARAASIVKHLYRGQTPAPALS